MKTTMRKETAPVVLAALSFAWLLSAAPAAAAEAKSSTTSPELSEALTAVAVGLLTIYDMCKSVDRGMQIEGVRLLEKSGGKSGHFKAA